MSSTWEEQDAGNDSGDEKQEDLGMWKRDNIICLIDARQNMLARDSDNRSLLGKILSAVAQLYKTKVMATGDADRIGVFLLGTQENKNADSTPHIYELCRLDHPSVEAIRSVESLAKTVDPDSSVGPPAQADTPHLDLLEASHPLPLDDALVLANKSFQRHRGLSGGEWRRIWIFSNDERPVGDNSELQQRCKVAADDRRELQEYITLFALGSPPLDPVPFWADIVAYYSAAGGGSDDRRHRNPQGGDDDDEGEEGDDAAASEVFVQFVPSDDVLQDVLAAMRSRVYRKRVYARLPFVLAGPDSADDAADGSRVPAAGGGAGAGAGGIGNVSLSPTGPPLPAPTMPSLPSGPSFATPATPSVDFARDERTPPPPRIALMVGLYLPIHPAKKPAAGKIDRTTHKPLKSVTQHQEESTGTVMEEFDICKAYPLGQSNISFSDTEVRTLRSFSDPNLRLVGFQPRSTLRDDFNLRSAYFVYPLEGDMKGSTKAFRALLEQMLERDVIGIARLVPRKRTPPRMVALLPQREEVEDGVQITPPGMFAVALPYQDEIRKVPVEPFPQASEEQVAEAVKMVTSLDLPDFSCRDFESPLLQKFYATLQALALGEESPEWDEATHDALRPDKEGIAQHRPQIHRFLESAGIDPNAPAQSSSARPKKRAAPSSSAAAAPKAKRAKTANVSVDNVDWAAAAAEEGKLESFKVPELKAGLKSLGLPVTGTKGVLVGRIKEHFGQG